MIELRTMCTKGHDLDLRLSEVRRDEEDKNSEIVCWLIFGVCDKCETIIMQGIHNEKIEPTEGIDYIILNEKIGKTRNKLR